jgi:hypothetical protein
VFILHYTLDHRPVHLITPAGPRDFIISWSHDVRQRLEALYSNCFKSKKARSIQIASSHATVAKVSLKSIPLTWVNPWATNFALFLVTTPCSSCLLQKTYLVSMTLLLGFFSPTPTLDFSRSCLTLLCIVIIQSGSLRFQGENKQVIFQQNLLVKIELLPLLYASNKDVVIRVIPLYTLMYCFCKWLKTWSSGWSATSSSAWGLWSWVCSSSC